MTNKAPEKKALIEKVRNSFDKPGPPKQPKAYELLPDSEAAQGAEVFWDKSWNELSIELFALNCDIFFYLPDEYKNYFVGGYIYRSIIEFTISENYDIFGLSKIGYYRNSFDIFSLTPALNFQGMNKRQKKTLLDYFVFCSEICKSDEYEIYDILVDRLAALVHRAN